MLSKGTKNTVLTIGLTILATLLAKQYLFEIYVIPSDSMSPTLIKGDVVFMNKLSYGRRFAHAGETDRSWGYTSPKKSDVMIFNMPIGDSVMSRYPMEDYYEMVRVKGKQQILGKPAIYGELKTYPLTERTVYIKRCIAAPGDWVSLAHDSIQVHKDTPTGKAIVPAALSQGHEDSGDMPATAHNLGEKVDWHNYIFPHSRAYPWDMDNWGPLYVPQQGDTLSLNLGNLPLYKRLISGYEGNTVKTEKGQIWINGKPERQYIVQKDYYLVMGDNGFFSHDSRFWGYLPEDHIIGKATFILFSYHEGKLAWDRFFKKL